jgi:hypothetical protein
MMIILSQSPDLQKYFAAGCRIEGMQPPVFASDAEIDIVAVTVVFPMVINIQYEHTETKHGLYENL